MDCRRVSAAERVCDCDEGVQCPNERKPTFFMEGTLLQSRLACDRFRVHHFARQLASPFPLLAAVGAKTSRIEIGTAVIDMRYENPLYMAEDDASRGVAAPPMPQL